MSFLVVRDGDGNVVAFGPNDKNYLPVVKAGQTSAIEKDQPSLPALPDVSGFKVALIGIFSGDFLAINALYAAYPLFKDMLDSQTWTVVKLILEDALDKAVITQTIYDAIKAALATYHIPVELK